MLLMLLVYRCAYESVYLAVSTCNTLTRTVIRSSDDASKCNRYDACLISVRPATATERWSSLDEQQLGSTMEPKRTIIHKHLWLLFIINCSRWQQSTDVQIHCVHVMCTLSNADRAAVASAASSMILMRYALIGAVVGLMKVTRETQMRPSKRHQFDRIDCKSRG